MNNLGQRNIDWFNRKNSPNERSSADVTVSIQRCSTTKNNYRIAFRFKDQLSEVIAPSGWMVVGVCHDRVYFKDDKINGMRCTSSKNDKKKQVSIRLNENSEVLKEFIGNYQVNYDKYAELYYIQKENDNGEIDNSNEGSYK